MFRILIYVGVIVVIVISVFFIKMIKGPDLSEYEYLKNPQIVSLSDEKVIEVSFNTNSDGLKDAFSVLYKTYFKTKGLSKMSMPISKARYSNAIDMDIDPIKRNEIFSKIIWKGSCALVISENVVDIPDISIGEMKAKLSIWKYGEVAEILHVGAYQDEPATVKKLIKHIEDQRYEVNGLHEEVYLRGPGTPFAKPDNYYTIIRYPVRKKS